MLPPARFSRWAKKGVWAFAYSECGLAFRRRSEWNTWMRTLPKTRHEAFAQGLASGQTATDAYGFLSANTRR